MVYTDLQFPPADATHAPRAHGGSGRGTGRGYDPRPWTSTSSSSGTAGSAPTAARGTSATLIRRGGDRLLVDCGEGTQRQLLRSDAGLARPRGRLPHPPSRRPRPRPAGDAEDLRAPRPRDRRHGPRPARDARAPRARCASSIGRLTYPLEVRELDRGRGDRAGRVPHRAVRGRPRSRRDRLRAPRGRPPRAASRSEAADALGVPDGPARGALQRGEPVTLDSGRVVRPEEVVGAAAAGTDDRR